jgi:hypothetical protein
MDQLRTALVWLKRHHFWVLSGLVAIIALVSWAKASSKLAAMFNQNQSAIKTEFNNVQNLRKDPFHPNEDVNAKQQEQTKQQAADVATLWKDLYERQRQHVLEWPSELSKTFRDAVDKLQFGAEIRSDLRNHYQNYIENHFPALPKQIDAQAIDASVTAGAGPGAEFGRGMSAEVGAGNQLQDLNDYICLWNPADQAIVRDDLNFREQPSSLKIWVTQENLWVYHTLLDVIAKTNKAANATRMSNAAVREIGELAVGPRAAQGSRAPGRLFVPPAVATAPGAGPGEVGPGGLPPGAGPPGAGPGGLEAGMRSEFSAGVGPQGNGPMTEEQERAYLLSGRYLDAQGKPIPFGGGGAAAAPGESPAPAPEASPAGAPLDLTMFGQEYKRLPVRMALRMDQRWLPRLIAECASEPLQVEVQEVRVNPPEGIASAGGAMGGGPGGGGGFRPGGGGLSGSTSPFQEEAPYQPFPMQPEMVNVIIQGTIYIFNKPNPAILQAPGEQPAGAQPPPTTAAAQ